MPDWPKGGVIDFKMKLILTRELGRLTRWLRLLGLDAAYFDSDDMKELFVTAFNKKRIVVTKRKRISGTKSLKVIYIKSDTLKEQLNELKKKIPFKTGSLFTRCADCNEKVFKVERAPIRGLVPKYVFKTQKKFYQCPSCARIFWRATHWDRAEEFLHEVRS